MSAHDTPREAPLEPNWLRVKPENVPDELKALPCCVSNPVPVWNESDGDWRWTKPPSHPVTGYNIGPDRPEKWSDFDTCAAAVLSGDWKLMGGLLPEGSGIVGYDVDKIKRHGTLDRNPAIKSAIREYQKRGGYVERSPSGDGLRIFAKGDPVTGRKKSNDLEMYSDRRYLTITGHGGGALLDDTDLREAFMAAIGSGGESARGEKQGQDKAHAGPETAGAKVTDDLLAKIEAATRETLGEAAERFIPKETNEDGIELGGYAGRSEQIFHLNRVIATKALEAGVSTDEATLQGVVHEVAKRLPVVHAWTDAGGSKWERDTARLPTIRNAVTEALKGWKGAKAGGGDKAPRPDLIRGDILASEYYIRDHNERLRYCPERGSYLGWNERHWEWVSQDDAIELGKETAGRLFDIAKAIMQQGDADKGGKAMRFAARYHSIDGMTAMVRTAKSAKAIRANYAELDADPEMFCARNGYAISLRTGEAYPPDRSKFFTRVSGVDYDPEATCPQWEAAMLAMFEGDQEMVDFMQRAIGYTATGYNSEEVFFCCFGHGENGKSVMQDTLTYVMGDMVCTGDVGALLVSRKNDTRIPNALAATAGARMLSLNETVGGDELDTRSLKLLAGREPISARFLHQEYFSFIPTATPWLRTNHRPIVKDDTHGTWRRIIPIPFRHQFTDEDRIPNIEQKLRSEGSGIQNWIVTGGVEYFKRGLSIPASIRREAQAYRSESDVLGQFLEEQTTADPTFRVEQGEVWHGWRHYCHGNGHHPGTKNSLSRRLKERGFPEWKSNGRRFYRGLTMRSSQGGVLARA